MLEMPSRSCWGLCEVLAYRICVYFVEVEISPSWCPHLVFGRSVLQWRRLAFMFPATIVFLERFIV